MYTKYFIVNTLLFISLSLSAQQKKTVQWQNLFNGKDLKGWKLINGTAKFEVKNGELIGSTVYNSHNSFLATYKEYFNL
jgi:Domain of Unknown Function (DUF1080)